MYKTIDEIDFFSDEVLINPFPANAIGRAQAPVYRVPGDDDLYLVFTYDLVKEALHKPEIFSSKNEEALLGRSIHDPECAAIYKQGWPQIATLLTNDPPDHTRFRRLVQLAFMPGRVNKLEGHVIEVIDRLIDGFIDKGRCDMLPDFAAPLPCTIISEQLGVPVDQISQVRDWSEAFVELIGSMLPQAEEVKRAHMIVEFQNFMKGLLDEHRANPKDGMLSDLINARIDDERPLDDAELLNVSQQLLVAGNATTSHTLSAGLYMLVANADIMRQVRDDMSLLPNYVNELLRLLTPTNNMWRRVTQDTELGGVSIPKGSRILLRYGSANRDEKHFENPDEIDLNRKSNPGHLAFGNGPHTCIGSMLARKELQCAYQRLLERMDNIRLAEGSKAPSFFPNILLRGIDGLEIEFDKKEVG